MTFEIYFGNGVGAALEMGADTGNVIKLWKIPQRGDRAVAKYIPKTTVPEVRNTGVVYLWHTRSLFELISTNLLHLWCSMPIY